MAVSSIENPTLDSEGRRWLAYMKQLYQGRELETTDLASISRVNAENYATGGTDMVLQYGDDYLIKKLSIVIKNAATSRGKTYDVDVSLHKEKDGTFTIRGYACQDQHKALQYKQEILDAIQKKLEKKKSHAS